MTQQELDAAYQRGVERATKEAVVKSAMPAIRHWRDVGPLLGLAGIGSLLGAGLGAAGSAINAGLTDEKPGENRRVRMRKHMWSGAGRGALVGGALPIGSALIATIKNAINKDSVKKSFDFESLGNPGGRAIAVENLLTSPQNSAIAGGLYGATTGALAGGLLSKKKKIKHALLGALLGGAGGAGIGAITPDIVSMTRLKHMGDQSKNMLGLDSGSKLSIVDGLKNYIKQRNAGLTPDVVGKVYGLHAKLGL